MKLNQGGFHSERLFAQSYFECEGRVHQKNVCLGHKLDKVMSLKVIEITCINYGKLLTVKY